MIIRNDLRAASGIVPQDLKDALVRVGGTNVYGEPLYRLILAQDRITRAAGEWNIWADDVPVEDRGGLGTDVVQSMLSQFHQVVEAGIRSGMPRIEIERMAKALSGEIDEVLHSKLAAAPLRVETGLADIELYPFEGWIIEKWKPAESFGSPGDWETYRFQGSNALGPYPTFGEYELLAGPTPYLPTAGQIEDAIRQDFRNIQSRPRSARERVALLMAKIEQRRKAKAREQANKAEAFRKDGPASLHNRLSLGAGRVMNELAKKVGITEHVGN